VSTAGSLNGHIQKHYAASDLGIRILEALAKAGKDVDHLTPEDLAPIDEFHIRGRKATLELAADVGLDVARYVLDIGSGVGGPSRAIVCEFGCQAVGIDLTGEYCRVAAMLAERTGLLHQVRYCQGNALHLPFPDGSFDIVWTQHAAMNIPRKARLYGEMYRVLKPGGAVAIYDVLAGPAGEVIFPVLWARSPETSFLITPEELRQHLEASGFKISIWEDVTVEALAWFARVAQKIQERGLPPLGIHLLMGPEFEVMAQNQVRNLEEERIVLAKVVGRK